jgi:hypothetical protein
MSASADSIKTSVDPVYTDDFGTYIEGLAKILNEIDDLARDTENDDPGWSIILDLTRCPYAGLPWLAQLAGMQTRTGLTDSEQRQWIFSQQGKTRGTAVALRAAAQIYLTGTKVVIFRERDAAACPTEPAYGLTIKTYTSQTPNSAQVLAALMAQKPAGIVLNYITVTGQDYQLLFTGNATYQAVFTNYTTYQGMTDSAPGT